MANWFTNPASNTMLDNSFRNQFFQNQVRPVQTGATNIRPTNLQALKNWAPWKTVLPKSWGGTWHTGPTAGASGALGMGTAAALPLGVAGLTHMVQRGLPEELKGEGGLFDTSTAAWGGMGAGAGIDPETDEILRANAIFSGNRPVEETVTDQWTLPQTDWGPVKPTEPLPERGKLDMFLQKFGAPPMTQVTDADRDWNEQVMQDQRIGIDDSGRMVGGDFAGKNAPGTSAWGSANFGEMAQKWDEEYGDMNYKTFEKQQKQREMKKAAAEYAQKIEADRQERIRNERAAASAANQMTQRDPTGGGASRSHMGNISQAQAGQVAAANAAAGMGGWGLAYGGRVGYRKGGRVGILAAF